MTWPRSWLAVLVLCLVVSSTPAGTLAQAGSGVLPGVANLAADSRVTVAFPEGLTIDATLDWDQPLDDAWVELVFSVGRSERLYLTFASTSGTAGPDGIDVSAWLGLQALVIPPGVEITYAWRLAGPDGVAAESEPESTWWQDDRQDWAVIESRQVSMQYFGLDEDFAAWILESSQQTITAMEQRFGLEPIEPIDIRLYPSRGAFTAALPANSRQSVAAVTFPDYSLVLALTPDGNHREAVRVVPHEVAHLAVFQATDNPFTIPPLWFNEGLATHIQTGGTEGYLTIVIAALERDALFSLASLNVSFPFTAAEATLAYATSWSALEYIMLNWGDDGIAHLIDAYATGDPWDAAMSSALGVTIDEFESGWRDWIASASLATAA